MDLSRFPRRRYTAGPTPLEPLPRFSAALAAQCPGGRGPEVWVKRDDLLGLFPGGNKTRKLEFLVADALAQGADTLVTCGAPQSNHCRITLAAAVKEGLKCRFVIEERVPGSYDPKASGNHFMFRLMGVEAITVVPGRHATWPRRCSRSPTSLAAAGPQGLRHSRRRLERARRPGLRRLRAGAAAAVVRASGSRFDRVVVGSGSSGTHGGLLAGFLGNNIDDPARSASASAATRPSRSRWCTARRRPWPTCSASRMRCRARR